MEAVLFALVLAGVIAFLALRGRKDTKKGPVVETPGEDIPPRRNPDQIER